MLLSGREPSHVEDVKRYLTAQGLFYSDSTPTPGFTSSLSLDLGTVEPSVAGPKRPQDRVALADMNVDVAEQPVRALAEAEIFEGKDGSCHGVQLGGKGQEGKWGTGKLSHGFQRCTASVHRIPANCGCSDFCRGDP